MLKSTLELSFRLGLLLKERHAAFEKPKFASGDSGAGTLDPFLAPEFNGKVLLIFDFDIFLADSIPARWTYCLKYSLSRFFKFSYFTLIA